MIDISKARMEDLNYRYSCVHPEDLKILRAHAEKARLQGETPQFLTLAEEHLKAIDEALSRHEPETPAKAFERWMANNYMELATASPEHGNITHACRITWMAALNWKEKQCGGTTEIDDPSDPKWGSYPKRPLT
jgi:hypothetical protein